MADSVSTADQWLEAQRRYWDAWMDMTRRGLEGAGSGRPAPQNPWADAMEQWLQAVAPATPKPASDLLEQMVNVGKGYFSMVEGFYKEGPVSDMPEMIEKWTRMMTEAFQGGGASVNPFAQLAARAGGRQGTAFWDLPFDTLSRTLSGSMPLPGDFMKAFESGKPTEMREQLEGLLSTPAIGYGRESQEQYQQFARLMLDYEKAMNEYQAGFANLGTRSVDAFQKRIQAAADEGKTINSVREVFNIWVDACEEAYAEYAMSDDYARRYGRMVNSLMAVKKQGVRLVDEWLEAMNIPTASEISTLQRRLHDTRSDYHAVRSQMERMQGELDEHKGANGEVQRLREEVAELRAALEKQQAGTASEAAAAGSGADTAAAAAAEKPKRSTRRTGSAASSASGEKKTTTARTRKTGTTRRKTQ
ncbi:class III poly(R)-hydroxyalkanoic acid synthase subunit PhaE [Thioalkalivibrio sp.]|uniref:class III poly(R)-hydroxyalkanoic acid synthase subunit PhaE n=1 Tax=Thioalkalivibrio sp. TaxID=2093813 RepID=UPI0035650552